MISLFSSASSTSTRRLPLQRVPLRQARRVIVLRVLHFPPAGPSPLLSRFVHPLDREKSSLIRSITNELRYAARYLSR